MNDVQENKFSMYIGVVSFFDLNAAKVAAIPALVTAVDEFKVLKNLFDDLEVLAKGTAGKAEAKRIAKSGVAELTAQVASLVYAFGSRIMDTRLQEIGSVPKRNIIRARDTQVPIDARVVINAAEQYAAELADFGLSAALLGELEAALAGYNDAMGAMSLARTRRTAAVKELVSLFKRCDGLLRNILDGLMENFRSSDRQFYNEYKSVRMIVDRK